MKSSPLLSNMTWKGLVNQGLPWVSWFVELITPIWNVNRLIVAFSSSQNGNTRQQKPDFWHGFVLIDTNTFMKARLKGQIVLTQFWDKVLDDF